MPEVDNPRAIRSKIIRIKLELSSSIPPARRLELEQNLHRLEERLEELTESTTSPDDNLTPLRAQSFMRQ